MFARWQVINTRNAAICNFEELFVATRITKERRIDDNRALPATCACAVQQEMDVDVTVAREGYLTECRDQCVISTVSCRLEYDDVGV